MGASEADPCQRVLMLVSDCFRPVSDLPGEHGKPLRKIVLEFPEKQDKTKQHET